MSEHFQDVEASPRSKLRGTRAGLLAWSRRRRHTSTLSSSLSEQAPWFSATTPDKHHGRGFTLIELLLVVGAISLFSMLILAGMSTYRVKARDAVRLSDIRQLQNALEIYQVANKTYPVCQNGDFCDVDCGLGVNNDGYDGANYQDLSDFLTTQYFQRMPPKLNNVCLWYWGHPNGNRYILTFLPEDESRIVASPGNQNCYEDGGDPWYCVGNQGQIGGVGL